MAPPPYTIFVPSPFVGLLVATDGNVMSFLLSHPARSQAANEPTLEYP